MAAVVGSLRRLVADIRETADMIKFQHSVFALPFAIIALISADDSGWPPLRVWFWVMVAMVAARTAAMSFNRLVDHDVDAENPRTSNRSLPAGRLSRSLVWAVTISSVGLFVVSAAMLNRLCLLLAAPTTAVLLGYSFAKRFTAGTHFWLGGALAIAPAGAWIAVTGGIAWPPVILGAAVVAWVAGFDIIYSLQDAQFDRRFGLHSIPARWGVDRALAVSRAAHFVACVGFAVFAVMVGGGWLRWLAVFSAAGLLISQHWLVSANDLSRVDAAFFSANGILAVAMGCLFLAAKITGW